MVLRSRYFCNKCGENHDFLYGTALNYDTGRVFKIPENWGTDKYVRRDSQEALRLLVLDDDVVEAAYNFIPQCDEFPNKYLYKHDDFICTECQLTESYFFFSLKNRNGERFYPHYKCPACGGKMRLAEAYIRDNGAVPKRFRCNKCGEIQSMGEPDEYECLDYRITECLKL
ncbi:MAG: hypothetical protein RBR05_03670 [Candidatus Methanomethylophilaceae archaeon]|nr:hypothetical protein [Candidatus Methanomethylophilaceae archaeon]MDD3379076.1 hypothetical protein [Candidatus Methanomethylophilaceae archaeon]MDY0224482.1 hypothetical protein [Candidatus Methanomethylophilaceae archaeon]